MNIETRKIELGDWSQERLITEIIDTELNDFVGGYADYKDDEQDPHGHGKRVPYIGWFWRTVNFADGHIVIADCGSFVGFCENNKWGYPQRTLTPDEAQKVIAIVEEAHSLDRGGGVLSEIVESTHAKLEELWPLMQSFEMDIKGYWIIGPMGQVGFAGDEDEADTTIALLSDAAPGINYFKVPAGARSD